MGLVSINNNFPWILLIIAINFFLCLVAMVIVRYLAPLFVYVIVIAFVIVGLGSTSFAWYEYYDVTYNSTATTSGLRLVEVASERSVEVFLNATNVSTSEVVDTVKNITSSIENSKQVQALRNSVFLLPICIGLSVLDLIILVLIVWTRKSAKLSLELIKEANSAFFGNIAIIAIPFVTGVLLILLFGAMVATVALCFSNVAAEVDLDGLVTYVIDPHYHAYVKVAYVAFVYVWLIFFVLGCQKVVLSDVFSSWYFKNEQSLAATCCKCFCPAIGPVRRLVKYNLGSVVFGSLFVAIAKVLRLLAYVFGYELKKKGSV